MPRPPTANATPIRMKVRRSVVSSSAHCLVGVTVHTAPCAVHLPAVVLWLLGEPGVVQQQGASRSALARSDARRDSGLPATRASFGIGSFHSRATDGSSQ